MSHQLEYMLSQSRARSGTTTEEFFAGDPIIGQQIDLGPHTYFAANIQANSPPDPEPAEQSEIPGTEPMALFEFHINNAFSGKSHLPEDRPRALGIFDLTAEEQIEYGVIIDPGPIPSATFDTARKDALLIDYRALSHAEKIGTVKGRNIATRIARLGGDPAEGIPRRPNRTLPDGWKGKEEYQGLINDSISFQPFASIVLKYFAGFNSYNFFARFFNYHSDEQCGQVHGCVSIDKIPLPSPGRGLLRRFPNNMDEQDIINKQVLS